MGHHLGLTSMPQVMHTLSPFCATELAVSVKLSMEGPPFAAAVVVDARLFGPEAGWGVGVLVARAIRLAFRTVPVRVRSACLKFCT